MNPGARLTLKVIESIGIGLGPAIAVLNLFSFNLARSGSIYYKSGNSWGIAIGVLLVCIAIVARRWRQ
jgi:hypothetical protein